MALTEPLKGCQVSSLPQWCPHLPTLRLRLRTTVSSPNLLSGVCASFSPAEIRCHRGRPRETQAHRATLLMASPPFPPSWPRSTLHKAALLDCCFSECPLGSSETSKPSYRFANRAPGTTRWEARQRPGEGRVPALPLVPPVALMRARCISTDKVVISGHL